MEGGGSTLLTKGREVLDYQTSVNEFKKVGAGYQQQLADKYKQIADKKEQLADEEKQIEDAPYSCQELKEIVHLQNDILQIIGICGGPNNRVGGGPNRLLAETILKKSSSWNSRMERLPNTNHSH